MLSKCAQMGADAIMLDLEDSVAPSRKVEARQMVFDVINEANDQLRQKLWVRINSWQSGLLEEDLEQLAELMPTGYLLPKARSARDVTDLDRLLDNTELSDEYRRSRIISMVTEVPEALMTMNTYHSALPRLEGLSWGAEDLSSALGAKRNREADGSWVYTYEYARSQCLLTASASKVSAIDTVYIDYRDHEGLKRYAQRAARDGFDGMLAIHPGQVEIINQAFTPSDEEVSFAHRVVDAFEQNPHAGAIGIDGKMFDLPHLYQARQILEKHREIGQA